MPSSKAAASEEARRTLRYVEPLSDARTPLADFFSILLTGDGRISEIVRRFHGLYRPDQDFSVEGGHDQMFPVTRPL